MFYLEPEPKKKISGAGAEEKWLGSATLVESLLLSEPEPAKKTRSRSKTDRLRSTNYCLILIYFIFTVYSLKLLTFVVVLCVAEE